jgi:ABC-type phosphate transport system ATPase subunit
MASTQNCRLYNFYVPGEIIEQGPAIELLENPKEKLTREYVKGVIC